MAALRLALVPSLLWLAAPGRADRTCGSLETCRPLADCSYYDELVRQKDELAKGSRERTDIVNEIKSQICDRSAGSVCCPPCPTYGDSCVATSSCPAIQAQLALLPGLRAEGAADEAAQIVAGLKGRICEKATRKLCCGASEAAAVVTTPRPAKPSGPLGGNVLPGLPGCGSRGNDNGQQVVGGENSEVGEFPWAVLLGQKRKRKKKVNGRLVSYTQDRWSCGGTLITRRFVLTAAHCQGRSERTRLSLVRLGEYSVVGYTGDDSLDAKLPPEQDFVIQEEDVVIHEEYQTKIQGLFKNILNDIAIIRLPRLAEINAGVQMVCMPHLEAEYRKSLDVTNLIEDLEGRHPTVVGWGYTSGFDPWSGEAQGDLANAGVASRVQQKLALPLLNTSDCSEQYNGFEPHTASQICAGGEIGKDSCKGDSGGGLYTQKDTGSPWYLVGLVSFGAKVCGSGRPGVYSRTSYFLPWIQEQMDALV